MHAKSEEITTLIHILTALIGNLNSPYRKLSSSCLLLWLFNLTANFTWNGFESRAKYGCPWLFVRGLLWVKCCVCTWGTICRAVPWLERGLGGLAHDRQYSEVLGDISRATKVSWHAQATKQHILVTRDSGASLGNSLFQLLLRLVEKFENGFPDLWSAYDFRTKIGLKELVFYA